jgi:hypothetical protein
VWPWIRRAAGFWFPATCCWTCAKTLAERLGREANQATVESLLEHLGGEIALTGLGNLGVERWGRALVMTFDGSPAGSGGDTLLAAVLEGAIQRVFGRDCSVVKLERDAETVRLLVASSKTASSVREALSKGASWGELLEKLHEQPSDGE